MSQRPQSWYASDATSTLILLLIAVEIVASVLFLIGFVLPACIAEINRGYLAVSEQNIEASKQYRLAQYEHRLQWESHIDKFFVLRCNTDQAGGLQIGER